MLLVNQMNKKRKNRDYTGWTLENFVEAVKDTGATGRTELGKLDSGLDHKIRQLGYIEIIFPETRYKKGVKKRRHNAIHRPSGFWKDKDPVAYFNEHYSHIKTREELKKTDSGCYRQLNEAGKLDEIFGSIEKRDFNSIDLKEHYNTHYSYCKRPVDLSRADMYFYRQCLKAGIVPSLFPKTDSIDAVLQSYISQGENR